MGEVVARSSEPALGAIKLAWWRERLEELDQGKVPAEPRLQAAASELIPLGITGASLAGLEEGWAALLQQDPDPEAALRRGARLFAIGARLLEVDYPLTVEGAGTLYAAGQIQRLGMVPDGAFVVTELRAIPPRLRPLTGLAALAKRDLHRREPEATPVRAFALLRHRLTGRL